MFVYKIPMCGRFSLPQTLPDLMEAFEVPEAKWPTDTPWTPAYNIAPSSVVPVIVLFGGRRLVVPMQWGLIPHWESHPPSGKPQINARFETIDQKATFRDAFKKRRALVPLDSFYEWMPGQKDQKVPFRIYPGHDGPTAMAAIWDAWVGPLGVRHFTFAVVTMDAAGGPAAIHSRMPVLLRREDFSTWLNPTLNLKSDFESLIQNSQGSSWKSYRVSAQVNKPSFEGPDCHHEENDLPMFAGIGRETREPKRF